MFHEVMTTAVQRADRHTARGTRCIVGFVHPAAMSQSLGPTLLIQAAYASQITADLQAPECNSHSLGHISHSCGSWGKVLPNTRVSPLLTGARRPFG